MIALLVALKYKVNCITAKNIGIRAVHSYTCRRTHIANLCSYIHIITITSIFYNVAICFDMYSHSNVSTYTYVIN